MSVYNVLWADDDLHNILGDFNITDALKDKNINVIGKAYNADELSNLLEKLHNQVHAVIVDANMDEYKIKVNDERNTSGLTAVLGLVKQYWGKYQIPFYLFTGRSRTDLLNKYPDDELRYFKQPGHWFEKYSDGYKRLFEQITTDVDEINSPVFQLRNKYSREFEAASFVEGASSFLEKGLMYDYNSSWKEIQDYFNPARKIVERIFDKCKENGFLPNIESLNGMKNFLANGKSGNLRLVVDIMPKPLICSLDFFLSITQDGSHDNSDLALGVDSYVRNMRNSNLYNSILFIAMDLLLWYKSLLEKYGDEDFTIWEGSNYIYEGKVCYNPNGNFFYTGKYELQSKMCDLSDGDKVGIIKSIASKYPKGSITEFVFISDYKIIK